MIVFSLRDADQDGSKFCGNCARLVRLGLVCPMCGPSIRLKCFAAIVARLVPHGRAMRTFHSTHPRGLSLPAKPIRQHLLKEKRRRPSRRQTKDGRETENVPPREKIGLAKAAESPPEDESFPARRIHSAPGDMPSWFSKSRAKMRKFLLCRAWMKLTLAQRSSPVAPSQTNQTG
jgi:hypothetical protein